MILIIILSAVIVALVSALVVLKFKNKPNDMVAPVVNIESF